MAIEEPRGKRIEATIPISAGRDRVWGVLTDLPGWTRWNPLVPRASGTLSPGAVLDISVALPGMKPAPARPTIIAADPVQGLRYATRGAGGLMRAHRYVMVEPQDGNRCVVRNGEIFAGPLGRLIAALMGRKIARGMAAMNDALKAEAETPAT